MKKWMLLLPMAAGALFADVKLPNMFTDHAVLVKSQKTPVFGKADAGEEVTVELGGVTGKAMPDANGKWRVNLDVTGLGEGPYVLNVSGKNKIAIKDVVFGEVWLCSGQSNMGFTLNSAEGAKEAIASSDNNKIRLLNIRLTASLTPKDDINGKWAVASPASVRSFTAVGYFFGREIQSSLGKNIGLINNAWGGSACEAWVTMEELAKDPNVKVFSEKEYDKYVNFDKNKNEYLKKYLPWLKETNREEPTANTPPEGLAWKKVPRISYNYHTGNGIVWFRRKINLTAEQAQKNISFTFGSMDTVAKAFVDGKEISSYGYELAIPMQPRWDTIKANTITAGEHELVFRCHAARGKMNYQRVPRFIKDIPDGWEMALQEYPQLSNEQTKSCPAVPPRKADTNKIPGLLYNGLIAPLLPYSISGAIWYQGEANSGRAKDYPFVIRSMINLWRKDFESDFPFYYCQLANYMRKSDNPAETGWANIRIAQEGALKLPKTGQAVLIDVGEANDIHPLDKLTVGKRLAAIALNQTYGKTDMVYSGPVCTGKKQENNTLRLNFKHVHAGLQANPVPEFYFNAKAKNTKTKTVRNSPNSELEGFAIAGPDGKWYWADAKIDGDTVVVWNKNVTQPVKVRYAFGNNPTCNLYNKDGFPCGPFEK